MTHYNSKGEVTHYNSKKMHCPNSHEYDSVDSRGYRVCMTCKLNQQKEARRRRAVESARVLADHPVPDSGGAHPAGTGA